MPISELAAALSAPRPTPIRSAADIETLDEFFKRPEVRAFYAECQEASLTSANLQACADLLPALHPSRASALALMCGSLVEQEADPVIAFPALQALLQQWLQALRPYCAQEVEDDDEDVDAADRQAWKDAVASMAALPVDQRWEVQALQQAVDVLVLPMMTMLMRSRRNHEAFVSDDALIALLHPMATNNDSLPFEELHFLWMAYQISYEDELIVVLPTSKTGFVARAHAINNTFHAFTLLQILIREHAKALGVTRDIAAREPDLDGDSADFQWLQAGAYTQGELTQPMLWAWGEAALQRNMSKHGKRVLIALETDKVTKRSWSGFNGIIHQAHAPSMTFTRYLTADEVELYLQ